MSRTGWRRTRLKYVADCNREVLAETTNPDFTFAYVDISAVTQGNMALPEELTQFGAAPSRARRLAEPHDTVISTVRTYLRAVAAVPDHDEELVFSTGFAVLHPTEDVDPRFLGWYLQGDEFVSRVEAASVGVSYPAITAADVMAMDLVLPPLAEQRAIADYLDRETAQIDTLIAKQESLMERLSERTYALHASAFMDAPGRRETTVRRVLEPLRRDPVAGLGVVTAYRDGQVTLRSNRRDEGYTVSFTESGYQEVRPGDLVFHALDGFAGAVGISDSRGNCTPVYHVCRAVGDDDLRFVSEYLRFLGTSGYLALQAPNVRERSVDFRNWSTFARVPLSLPGTAMQRTIVRRLAEAARQASELESRASRFITLARERRAALISAAVTGNLDFRAAA